jgi:hypothetical protein
MEDRGSRIAGIATPALLAVFYLLSSILDPRSSIVAQCPPAAPEATPAPELARFPPPQIVQDARDFNRAVYASLQGQQLMRRHLWWEYQEILDGCNQSFRAWDALDDAQSGSCGPRADALERLRLLIGDEAYYAGRMPPAVPYWLLPEID